MQFITISIHAPAEGATESVGSFIAGSIFQSTLPRRERHTDIATCEVARKISIHAPAEGATILQISIYSAFVNFNPRSRGGSDTKNAGKNILFYNISIHAPAEGATNTVYAIKTYQTKFQSTLPRRERHTR